MIVLVTYLYVKVLQRHLSVVMRCTTIDSYGIRWIIPSHTVEYHNEYAQWGCWELRYTCSFRDVRYWLLQHKTATIHTQMSINRSRKIFHKRPIIATWACAIGHFTYVNHVCAPNEAAAFDRVCTELDESLVSVRSVLIVVPLLAVLCFFSAKDLHIKLENTKEFPKKWTKRTYFSLPLLCA